MKKFYLLCFLFILCSIGLRAQKAMPEVYLIKSDTAAFIGKNVNYYRILPDPSGKLTFKQVTTMQFPPVKAGGYVINDFHTNVYWRMFRLKNMLSKPVQVAIPASISRMDVFAADSAGRVMQKRIGFDVPWSQRSGLKRFNQAVFTLQPGEQKTFYARYLIDFRFDRRIAESPAFKVLKNEQQNAIDFYESRLNNVSIVAFLCGILFLAALVNVFFYTVSREKVYLYFALFGLFYTLLEGDLPIYDIFLKEVPVLARFNLILALFCGFFLWKFLSAFYDSRLLYPRWYKFSNYLSFGIFASSIQLFTTVIWSNIALSAALAGIIVLFVLNSFTILACSLFRGRQDKLFKLITALPFLFIGVIYLIADIIYGTGSTKTGFVMFVHNYGGDVTLVCFYWLVILFLWKMIQRFQMLQKQVLQEALAKERMARENEAERLQLIAGQKIALEQQVAERTAELHQSLSDL